MKRWKVLHCAPSLNLGGTEKVMQLFVEHLDRNRFLPAVWSPAPGPRGELLKKVGVPVFVGGRLEDVAEQFGPDIAHVHRAGWPQPETLRPLRAAFRPDPERPALRLPRIIETNVFGRRDDSPSGRLIDITLFVSHFCAERYATVEKVEAAAPRFRVLYNPVDTDLFEKLTPEPALRDYGRPVFGRISRADPGKWSTLALESLLYVRKKIPHFIFLVIGGTDEARAFVEKHGLGRNVRFLPPVVSDAEVAAFFNALSFLAHANDTGESFGLAIAEAMAAGLPVITHPCPGLRDNAQLELVSDGETGLVAEGAEAYGRAIIRLLRDPRLCRALGAAGRERARTLFRVQDIVRQLENVYEEALNAAE